MFIHNINPVAFSIGPISIYYYGLVYALGFIFTYIYLNYLIKKKRFNITSDQLDSLLIYLILGVIIGGRVGEFIFFQPQVLFSNPLQILYIWQGGMSFHGGVIGVVIALLLFCKKHKVHFYDITDKLVIPLSAVLIIGRIANFINAELVGTITKISWAVNFNAETNLAGEPIFRHPSQLYESLKNFITFIALLIIANNEKQEAYKKGYLSWIFVVLYGVGRTITDIWRDDGHWLLGLFSTGQLLSIIMAAIGLYILIKHYWSGKEYKTTQKRIKHKKTKRKKK